MSCVKIEEDLNNLDLWVAALQDLQETFLVHLRVTEKQDLVLLVQNVFIFWLLCVKL